MKRILGLVAVTLIPLTISCSWTTPASLLDQETEESVSMQNASFDSIQLFPDNHDLNNKRINYIIKKYGRTIKAHAHRYNIDWRFVLAIIYQESKFDTSAESNRGAIGLMQIMPTTFNDISNEIGIRDITNPRQNISAGIKHLSTLMEIFKSLNDKDRLEMALAAYNAGVGRINDAQQLATFLSDDSNSWHGVKGALKMLSKRYSTLHQLVWETDHPRSGYFNGSHQTIEYVDRVMEYYDLYQKMYD